MQLTKRYSQFLCGTSLLSKLFGHKCQNVVILCFILFTTWFLLWVDIYPISQIGTTASFLAAKHASYGQSENSVTVWLKQNLTVCTGNFIGYGGEFAWLSDVILDPSKNFAIFSNTVTTQTPLQLVTDVVQTFGYFSVDCQKRPMNSFNDENHLNKWMASTKFLKRTKISNNIENEAQFTIAVKRYE